MPTINILDQNTINQIAAGEVIERPASVVKELVENSIDAGADAVTVEIKGGGIELIRITDNGCGIEPKEIRKAFLSHATSKICTAADLADVMSLGFRGEALASIASVAEVEMLTKTKGEVLGTRYVIKCGEEMAMHDAGCPEGTTILVRDLFASVPVRKKFLKSAITEASYVSDLMERIALSHPDISIKYINNGKTLIFTNGNGSAKDVIYGIYGRDITNALVEIPGFSSFINSSTDQNADTSKGDIGIRGYVAKPIVARSNRSLEHFFVNGRYIRNNVISKAIEEAYAPYMMQHKYPFTVLFLKISPEKLDVNVHPTKQEVRFSNPDEIFDTVYKGISDELKKALMIPEVTYQKPDNAASARERTLLNEAFQKAPEPFMKKIPDQPISDPYMKESVYQAAPVSVNMENSNSITSGITGTECVGIDKSDQKDFDLNTSDINTAELSTSGLVAENNAEYSQLGFVADKEKIIHEILPENSEEFKNNMKSGFKIVGQVFDTYWIVQRDNTMYIIDQHAAHEKIIYEHIISRFSGRLPSQHLMPPLIISFTSSECACIADHIGDFNNIGFELEKFSGNEYALSGIPDLPYGLDPKALLMELIDSYNRVSFLKTSGQDGDQRNMSVTDSGTAIPEALRNRLATCSCKAAVKGNTKLSYDEARSLILQLLELENPFNCPHGRPVIIEMSKYELERKFKRIV
ncbi:MAG: DNA mismatch repair endonuclease MutL [Lachnospiraceae bacterium]|nr:DNA mismatch repair endonuclease MutL [Lachnospiraceae bacterium]